MTLQLRKYITNTKYQKTQAKKIIQDHGQAICSSNALSNLQVLKMPLDGQFKGAGNML